MAKCQVMDSRARAEKRGREKERRKATDGDARHNIQGTQDAPNTRMRSFGCIMLGVYAELCVREVGVPVKFERQLDSWLIGLAHHETKWPGDRHLKGHSRKMDRCGLHGQRKARFCHLSSKEHNTSSGA